MLVVLLSFLSELDDRVVFYLSTIISNIHVPIMKFRCCYGVLVPVCSSGIGGTESPGSDCFSCKCSLKEILVT